MTTSKLSSILKLLTYVAFLINLCLGNRLNVLSKFNSRLVFLTLHAALNAYELYYSAQYLDCIFCWRLRSSKSKSATLFYHLISSRCKYLFLSGQAVFFFWIIQHNFKQTGFAFRHTTRKNLCLRELMLKFKVYLSSHANLVVYDADPTFLGK